jgi:hypothetical protein
MAPDLSRLNPTPKDGNEHFSSDGTAQATTVQDFWRWSVSDLMSNATRGILAEFIVAQALGIDTKTTVRQEWDAFDLTTQEGKKIEVKSSAYLQTWGQSKLSTIQFGIAPAVAWDPDTGKFKKETPKRHSDVYVFCLLKHKDKKTVDPLKLEQWDFYVLPTSRLNERDKELGYTAKSIGLAALKAENAGPVGYGELKGRVTEATTKR